MSAPFLRSACRGLGPFFPVRNSTMPQTHVCNNQGFWYARFRVNHDCTCPAARSCHLNFAVLAAQIPLCSVSISLGAAAFRALAHIQTICAGRPVRNQLFWLSVRPAADRQTFAGNATGLPHVNLREMPDWHQPVLSFPSKVGSARLKDEACFARKAEG